MKKHIKPNKNRRNREQIYKRRKKGSSVKDICDEPNEQKANVRKTKNFTKNKK